MPDAVSIGPLALPPLLPGVLLAFLAAHLVLRYVLPRGGMAAEAAWIRDRLPTALFAGFIAWKLWPLLRWYEAIMDQPSLLLRMPGGSGGIAAGAVLALVILIPGLRAERTRMRPLFMTVGVAATVFAFSLGVLQAMPGDQARLEFFDGQVAESGVELLVVSGVTEQKDLPISSFLEPGDTPLVLTFWATWCAPCAAELPIKEDFLRRHEGRVRYAAVNLLRSEPSRSDVAHFVRDHRMSYPVLLDTSGRLATLFGVRGTPTTVVIDSSGTVVARWMGPSSLDRLERAFRRAAEQPPAVASRD